MSRDSNCKFESWIDQSLNLNTAAALCGKRASRLELQFLKDMGTVALAASFGFSVAKHLFFVSDDVIMFGACFGWAVGTSTGQGRERALLSLRKV